MFLVRLLLATSVVLPEGGILGVLCRPSAIANTFFFWVQYSFFIDLDMCFFLIFVCGDVEKLEHDWRDLNTLETYFLKRR